MRRGAAASVSAIGQSLTHATVAMKLAVAASIANARARAACGSSSTARSASTSAATATSGAANEPPKPSITANAIAAIAMPRSLPRAASVIPRRIQGTSSKPKKFVQPRKYATAKCPESANTGATTSAAGALVTRRRSQRNMPSMPATTKRNTISRSARSAPNSTLRSSVGEAKRLCGAPTPSSPPQ